MTAKQIADELVKMADTCVGTPVEGLLCAIAGGLNADGDLNGPCSTLFLKTLQPKVELLMFLVAALLFDEQGPGVALSRSAGGLSYTPEEKTFH